MNTPKESFINFYNPPSTTPVRVDNSHYTADPHLFPLPTHHLYCPHCRNESLLTRLPHRNPPVNRPTTAVYSSSTYHAVARTKTPMA